jgi:hypothetical protein
VCPVESLVVFDGCGVRVGVGSQQLDRRPGDVQGVAQVVRDDARELFELFVRLFELLVRPFELVDGGFEFLLCLDDIGLVLIDEKRAAVVVGHEPEFEVFRPLGRPVGGLSAEQTALDDVIAEGRFGVLGVRFSHLEQWPPDCVLCGHAGEGIEPVVGRFHDEFLPDDVDVDDAREVVLEQRLPAFFLGTHPRLCPSEVRGPVSYQQAADRTDDGRLDGEYLWLQLALEQLEADDGAGDTAHDEKSDGGPPCHRHDVLRLEVTAC